MRRGRSGCIGRSKTIGSTKTWSGAKRRWDRCRRPCAPSFAIVKISQPGHSLVDQTVKALEASQFLIVICSPNAARSKYVD